MAISSWVPPPPPDPNTLQNPPPFEPFPLVQVRNGKIKKSLGNGRIETAIFKSAISGPVEITGNGIVGDEHAYEAHRSPDKALLHYCTSHYDDWKREIPTSEAHFKPGAFGENIFSTQVNEGNVCIGDRIAIGDIIVEVSEPRAPCYKLNHRFEVKDMAQRTQTLFRTGWLYRVVKPGTIEAGDMIHLLERPHPEWTVARVMYYLFIETGNKDKMKEMLELPQLGEDIKGKFRTRLAKGVSEDQDGRMYGSDDDKMDAWNECRVAEKRRETSKITAIILETIEDIKDPTPIEPGSHVRLKLGGKLVRAYSVISGTTKRFELGIALDANGRGGSKYLHEQVQIGDVITAGRITPSFPLALDADKHILIAGGIGITAFLAALAHLHNTKQDFQLHYAVSTEVPFKELLTAFGPNATVYNSAEGTRMDLTDLLSQADNRTHIYTCGPERLMDAVSAAANHLSIPESLVHKEAFTVTTSGDPFTAELQSSNKTIEVGATQTLLDVLKEVGMAIDSSCEVGNCGTCRVDVLDGRIEHKGTGLLDEEKDKSMLACVSRGVGRIILGL
ncbi:uncharacterized protein EKO05_0010643 [Ascochyta rabiei]|uniref:2 iron, 2 sulfur cluster binding n=1 Tax=Didymella rabiei TaxID=5454 RepID=A0A163KV22_DIDRA|nr:uncharacterized protein EKO05_0010643 [Ascochyta rabiei]KZM27270.1 2 iron, 2 sulfur cluster binding [Ascochyta rabiei]UPX20411.1 hypothetical protein EKO05_0010643 [Ascochyta rabiei]